jgi:hypothetical protein
MCGRSKEMNVRWLEIHNAEDRVRSKNGIGGLRRVYLSGAVTGPKRRESTYHFVSVHHLCAGSQFYTA